MAATPARREQTQGGRATLLRAVDTLVDLGILDRFELADGSPQYRVCGREHHHHLICIDCRRIEEIAVVLVPTGGGAPKEPDRPISLELHGGRHKDDTWETTPSRS